ncbi:ISAs1 family transposase [Nocardiopsis sp. LOL_012]|uniref:ISAs1 family transposase n=1 Tax=Nocardiopsis sp. LOL_012 TaxID=3345409 RepID=UPI003A83EB54
MPCLPAHPPDPGRARRTRPLDPESITDLRPYLDTVPDPRSPRGRGHPLTRILLICTCATSSGAESIDELAEWGQRAHPSVLDVLGARHHPLAWRRSPSAPTIDRVLAHIDGNALDAAIGAYLADQHQATAEATEGEDTPRPRRPAIALDGKALKGSARLGQRCRHLLSAITHHRPVTLAQAEVGAKTNETRRFRPLLRDLDLVGTVVTFDALHTVKDHLSWLVGTKKAPYIAVIKTNQPLAHQQISALPWSQVAIAHTRSETGHGRVESRSIKVMAIADSLSDIAFPHAKLAIRVHRRQQRGKKQTRETVYALTSLDAHQAAPDELAAYLWGQWAMVFLGRLGQDTVPDAIRWVSYGAFTRPLDVIGLP